MGKCKFLFAGFFRTPITRTFPPWYIFFVPVNHNLGVFLGTKCFSIECQELRQDSRGIKPLMVRSPDLPNSGITMHSRFFINKTNLFSTAICHYLCYLKKTLLACKYIYIYIWAHNIGTFSFLSKL